jgi:hypothetical protein
MRRAIYALCTLVDISGALLGLRGLPRPSVGGVAPGAIEYMNPKQLCRATSTPFSLNRCTALMTDSRSMSGSALTMSCIVKQPSPGMAAIASNTALLMHIGGILAQEVSKEVSKRAARDNVRFFTYEQLGRFDSDPPPPRINVQIGLAHEPGVTMHDPMRLFDRGISNVPSICCADHCSRVR